MEQFATVVGVPFRGAEAKKIVQGLTLEDGELLELRAEPSNEYDSNAVQVLYKPTGMHIGYLARENNEDIARCLNDGRAIESIEIVGFENSIKPSVLITYEEIPF